MASPTVAPTARPGSADGDGQQDVGIEITRGREHDDADDVEHEEDGRDRRPEADRVEVPRLQHEHEGRAVDARRHRQRARQHAAGDVEPGAGVAQVEPDADHDDRDEHGDADDRGEDPLVGAQEHEQADGQPDDGAGQQARHDRAIRGVPSDNAW